MDIQHSALVTPDQPRAEDAHESGKHDEIRLARVDRRGERGVEGVPSA
jgi:hypothetical protein